MRMGKGRAGFLLCGRRCLLAGDDLVSVAALIWIPRSLWCIISLVAAYVATFDDQFDEPCGNNAVGAPFVL